MTYLKYHIKAIKMLKHAKSHDGCPDNDVTIVASLQNVDMS